MDFATNRRFKGFRFTSAILTGAAAICLAFGGTAVAEPPDNDDFENAVNLGSMTNVTVNGTTADSTVQVGEPFPWVQLAGSVWFKWTAPADADGKVAIVRTCYDGESNFYGINNVFTGASLNSLFSYWADAFGTDLTGKLSGPCASYWIRAVAGETYHIQVGNEAGFPDERDAFTLTLRIVKIPKNDLRRNAISLKKKLPAKLTAKVAGAFGEPLENDVIGYPSSVWYAIKPVKKGRLKIEVCSDTDVQPGVYMFKLGRKGPFKTEPKYALDGKSRLGALCPNGDVHAVIRVFEVKKNMTYTLALNQNYWDKRSANKFIVKLSGNAKLKKVKKKRKKK